MNEFELQRLYNAFDTISEWIDKCESLEDQELYEILLSKLAILDNKIARMEKLLGKTKHINN